MIVSTPKEIRDALHRGIKAIDETGFVRLIESVDRTIMAKGSCPPQAALDRVHLKTHISPAHQLRNLTAKLRGDSPFDILHEGTRCTTDPPFEDCIKLEFQQLLCAQPQEDLPSEVCQFVSDVRLYHDVVQLLSAVLRYNPLKN